MEIAIRINDLAKQYRLGRVGNYRTLRDAVTNAATLPLRMLKRSSSTRTANSTAGQLIWALDGVSFDVNQGEVIGIIGRNGAGKSTLLKLLSRITEPTRGTAELHGRVGSLLEVGTGFHSELSGRENIYMNGALLGMRRAEIQRKFDEIVAFAEVDQFLDTPVKRYSSGMYMRLAFAVAAHLEPEILIVDEVLAVGDAAFQKKCLGKMGEVAKHGRTVLFVSHNMAAVQSLCSRAVLLQHGKLLQQGSVKDVVATFMESVMNSGGAALADRTDRNGDATVRVQSVRVENLQPSELIQTTSRLKITIGYKSDYPVQHPQFLMWLYDINHSSIYMFDSDALHGLPEVIPAEGQISCITDPINVTPGRCYLNIGIRRGASLADFIQYAVFFDVEAGDFHGTRRIPPRNEALCVLNHGWSYAAPA